ncbi:MAG: D-alanyl-D-alanine carboxypeptidase family protein [Pseudomonadota bacterium]
MKRTGKERFVVLVVLLLLFSLANPAQANPRHAAIAVDANTGEVLHTSNADASRYPASLTKMMTLYMLFEAIEQRKLNLGSRLRVSAHAAAMPSTNINLRSGDTISVREAIPALIVRSANDVAAVVAEALGGTESNFGRMMTDKARKLGMRSTTFRNASGLPNNEQKTTARDLATLSSRLIKDFPQHYHYFSTQSFSYKGVTYNTHNRMVRNTKGVDGLKTGFIRASGFNVATSAKRGNRRVIAVVMGGQTAVTRDQQMAQLLDRSFSRSGKTQRAEASMLEPESDSLLEKSPDPIVIQQIAQPVVYVEPERIASMNNNNWEVQIGSYLAHDRAQAQAQAVTRWVTGEVVITETEISNRRLYRARLIGLQESQARAACQNLARQGIDCLVVRSHG